MEFLKLKETVLLLLSCSIASNCATLWTVAHQAPQSMGFSRQKYKSELPFPPPGDLFNPGIKPASLVSPALAGGFFSTSTWEAPGKSKRNCREYLI